MAFFAKCSKRESSSRGQAAKNISPMANSLEMTRVYATRIATQVIHVGILRDRPVGGYVGDAVRVIFFVRPDGNRYVPIAPGRTKTIHAR